MTSEATCPKCGTKFKYDKNDTMPGCRDWEEVFCPVCDNNEPVTNVFTSGIPTAYVDSQDKK